MAEGQPSWDVLNTKVELQGKQIDRLSEDTAKQFVDFRESTKSQLTTLRSDVKGEFDNLRGSLESLARTLETNSRETINSSKINWLSLAGTGMTAVAVSSGILGTLATLRLTPIENDVKAGKEAQASIVQTLDKIVGKLDNFETRAELTERNNRTDSAIASNTKLIDTKISKEEIEGLIRERNTQLARMQQDIADQKVVNEKQAADLVEIKIALAKGETIDVERSKAMDRLQADIDKRATAEALDGIRLRLTDQRDRTNLLSNRVQAIYEKNYATPRQPCLDSGAGCGPVALPGPEVQPGPTNK